VVAVAWEVAAGDRGSEVAAFQVARVLVVRVEVGQVAAVA